MSPSKAKSDFCFFYWPELKRNSKTYHAALLTKSRGPSRSRAKVNITTLWRKVFLKDDLAADTIKSGASHCRMERDGDGQRYLYARSCSITKLHSIRTVRSKYLDWRMLSISGYYISIFLIQPFTQKIIVKSHRFQLLKFAHFDWSFIKIINSCFLDTQ